MRTNAYCEEAIVEHKVEEYKNILQDNWKSSKPDLTICRNKNYAFLLHSVQIHWALM